MADRKLIPDLRKMDLRSIVFLVALGLIALLVLAFFLADLTDPNSALGKFLRKIKASGFLVALAGVAYFALTRGLPVWLTAGLTAWALYETIVYAAHSGLLKLPFNVKSLTGMLFGPCIGHGRVDRTYELQTGGKTYRYAACEDGEVVRL